MSGKLCLSLDSPETHDSDDGERSHPDSATEHLHLHGLHFCDSVKSYKRFSGRKLRQEDLLEQHD